MPKIRTHKSTMKRIVRLTERGKIVLRRMSAQHRARFKSKRAKQLSSQTQVATKTRTKKILHLIGK